MGSVNGRYKPGTYKAPEPEEITIEGLGSFLVKPLSNREQDEVNKSTERKKDESDLDYAGRLGFAFMATALLEPKFTVEELEQELEQWTVREGSEFVAKVQVAAQVLDGEDMDAVRRRFRQKDD